MINIGDYFVQNGKTLNKNALVAKHGSHDQKTHAGGRGRGAGGGSSSQSTISPPAKMTEHLDKAKKYGADPEDIKTIEEAFNSGNQAKLKKIATYHVEATADWSRGGARKEVLQHEHLYTATINAGRALGGSKKTFPTLGEMGYDNPETLAQEGLD